MKSKVERVNNAITNIEEVSKYYLVELEDKKRMSKIPQNEYLRIQKSLKKIYAAVNSLRFDKKFENDTLIAIRKLNLSIKDLYEEGDYNVISFEIIKTNSYLSHSMQERDKKKLSELKQSYNGLSNFYKYRISKAELKPETGLTFCDKNQDNYRVIIEKYLIAKYNFKEIKYESKQVSEENALAIEEFNKMIKDNKNDEYLKNIYSLIRICIIKYANAEIIIDVISQIIALCQEKEFKNIKEKMAEMLKKYQKQYKDNREEYLVLLNVLNSHNQVSSTNKTKK